MKKIAAGIFLFFMIGAGSWYGVTTWMNRSQSHLPKDKVSQMILDRYGGTIKKVDMVQGNYKLTLIKDRIPYYIKVNGKTGEILSFTKKAVPETDNRQQKQMMPQENSNATVTLITKEKAQQLAMEKVAGTITSVDLDEEDGQLVYEVDIRQSKKKKATVVINAYSGKIESISFETDDD